MATGRRGSRVRAAEIAQHGNRRAQGAGAKGNTDRLQAWCPVSQAGWGTFLPLGA